MSLEERLGLRAGGRWVVRRLSRPLPASSAGVTLGSIAIVLLLLQALTGALLAVYYTPSWEGARDSVVRITKDVTFGWLIRSVHVWSAHLLVATVFLHLLWTFARRAYEKPREATWISGLALLGLVMAAAFTGQMLPMDDEAVQGAAVAGAYAGEAGMAELVKGGKDVGPSMLTRMFAGHVIWVPAGLLLLIAAHIGLVARHRLRGAENLEGTSPAFPRRLGVSILGAVAIVATLAFVLPAGIGPAPGGTASAKPLWMFLPVYQAAKFVSGPWTLLLLVGPPVFLLAIPFLPRKAAVAAMVLFMALFATFGILGALS